jgi:hypothetical protein
MLDCDLVDAHEHSHGINDEINSHQSGSTKIDHILVSNRIAPTIIRSGILPFDIGIPSDHRGMFVTFNQHQLFKAEIPATPDIPQRGLYSTNPKAISKYAKISDEELKQQKIYKRAKAKFHHSKMSRNRRNSRK